MKYAILGVVLAATVASAIPASADQVVIRAGEGGVAIGARDHHSSEYYRHHNWRHHEASCRTVRTRTVLPSGRVIYKTRKTC